MEEWKTYKLAELGTLARGKSKHRPRDAAFLYGGNYPFIQTGDVKEANHKLYKFTQSYSEDGLKQSKLWDAGTICITIAANIADTAILTFPACFPDSVIGFVADKSKCDVDFIEYLLQHYKKNIQSHSIGSVQENINLGTFERIEFSLPPLLLQQRIASILSSLDDKIELNKQMNQTLEEMAQAMFKHSFVDGIDKDNLPDGWRMWDLGELVSTISVTHRFPKPEIVFLNTSDISEGEVLISHYSNVDTLPGQAKKSIKRGDILYSEIRPGNRRYAYVNFDADEYVVSTKIMVLRSTGLVDSLFPYFYLTRQSTIDLLQNAAESRSGTFPQITFDQIREMKIALPAIDRVVQFNEETLRPTYELIFSNNMENKQLIETRDYLLPKLISGEVIPADLKQLEQAL